MTDVDLIAEAPGVTPIPGQTKTEARLEKGWGTDFEGRALFWIAVAFSAFQIVTATFSLLPSQIVRSAHVGFLLIVVFGVCSTLTERVPAKLVLGARHPQLRARPLSLGLLRRPDSARRRSQHGRHHGRCVRVRRIFAESAQYALL